MLYIDKSPKEVEKNCLKIVEQRNADRRLAEIALICMIENHSYPTNVTNKCTITRMVDKISEEIDLCSKFKIIFYFLNKENRARNAKVYWLGPKFNALRKEIQSVKFLKVHCNIPYIDFNIIQYDIVIFKEDTNCLNGSGYKLRKHRNFIDWNTLYNGFFFES